MTFDASWQKSIYDAISKDMLPLLFNSIVLLNYTKIEQQFLFHILPIVDHDFRDTLQGMALEFRVLVLD